MRVAVLGRSGTRTAWSGRQRKAYTLRSRRFLVRQPIRAVRAAGIRSSARVPTARCSETVSSHTTQIVRRIAFLKHGCAAIL